MKLVRHWPSPQRSTKTARSLSNWKDCEMLLRHSETERVPGLSTLSALTAQPAGLPWQPVDKRKDPKPVAVIRVPKLWSAPPRSSAATAVKLVTEEHGL